MLFTLHYMYLCPNYLSLGTDYIDGGAEYMSLSLLSMFSLPVYMDSDSEYKALRRPTRAHSSPAPYRSLNPWAFEEVLPVAIGEILGT